MANSLVIKVKGTSYRQSKDICAARMLEKGDIVILQREPINEYDSNSIKVMTRTGNMIGYVDREYTELLSQNFDRLIATVESIKNLELPFITIKVIISDTRIPQPEILTDSKQMTASERMMVLEDIVKTSKQDRPFVSIPEGYHSIGCLVSWTNELPRENVLRAKKCKEGESVKLRLNSQSRYKDRIEIYTEDDILIGFIDEEANPGLASAIEYFVSPYIYSCQSFNRMTLRFLCPSEISNALPTSQSFYDYQYKEVGSAQYLAKEDPLAALDIIQYAIEHEKGITAKSVAMTCYWHLKDWESRRAMAQRMIDTIESIPEDELDGFTYNLYHTRTIPELRKNIETCEKKINSKKKKK